MITRRKPRPFLIGVYLSISDFTSGPASVGSVFSPELNRV